MSLVARWLFRKSGELPCRLIHQCSKPYLERYYLGGFAGWHFYLHRFVNADGDRDIHDHPWDLSVSVMLTGMYWERRMVRMNLKAPGGLECSYKWRKAGSVARIFGNTFHQIVESYPETWTIFAHGKRTKGWGFLTHFRGTLVYRPYVYKKSMRDWWLTAPLGKNAKRQELLEELK